MSEDALYRFWGKADPAYPGECKWHSAILHMLDVACVAEALLEQPGQRRDHLLGLCSGVANPGGWLVFLAALHDIGKVSPGFQKKLPDWEQSLRQAKFPFAEIDEANHGLVGYALLVELLRSNGGCDLGLALAQGPAAHHGRFFYGTGPKKLRAKIGDGPWVTAREQIVTALRVLFGLAWENCPWRGQEALPTAPLMLFAGLITIADWIGSDASPMRFPYHAAEGLTLADYRADRLQRARRLVGAWQLASLPVAPGESRFAELFAFDAPNPCQPNPCQQATLAVARTIACSGPGLLIIETPMGSGKTEAALAAADIWLRERGAAGLYYALPTQATANQMFGRVHDFLKRNPGVHQTELHLIHSYAMLQASYAALRAQSHPDGAELCASSVYDEDNATQRGNVTASDWFTGRKRGLLAPFAVGTVDQTLMAGLRVKHMFVRLFGLAGKVVVIDEVHAYDTYTSALLENLLRWLAQLGTTVILLSATLPPTKRKVLLKAYRKDAQCVDEPHYPCVIGVGTTGCVVTAAVTGLSQQPYHLEPWRLTQEQRYPGIAARLVESLAHGGCAACILNTVGEAQALFSHLSQEPALADAERILFHARFPMGQRLLIEQRLQAWFGKERDGTGQRPRKAIVVATQVLEQSLDVDFDLMISDLAPIDLLLQRAGRLHRHDRPRPQGLEQATLYVLQPPDLRCKKPDLRPSSFVYAPLLLVKTALLLEEATLMVREAADLERLICRVYEEGQGPAVPSHLQDWADNEVIQNKWEATRQKMAAQGVELPAVWDAEEFFEAGNNVRDDDDAETQAFTRLTRPSITIIIVYDFAGQPSLVAERLEPVRLCGTEPLTLDEARALQNNSVSVSDPDWVKHFKEQEPPERWQRSSLLRHCRLARFHDGELRWGKKLLRVSKALGVEVINPEKKR